MSTTTLKWKTSDGKWYEYSHYDSAVIGKMYSLKSHEKGVVELQVWLDGKLFVERNIPNGEIPKEKP